MLKKKTLGQVQPVLFIMIAQLLMIVLKKKTLGQVRPVLFIMIAQLLMIGLDQTCWHI